MSWRVPVRGTRGGPTVGQHGAQAGRRLLSDGALQSVRGVHRSLCTPHQSPSPPTQSVPRTQLGSMCGCSGHTGP